jgi:hypothetical protein
MGALGPQLKGKYRPLRLSLRSGDARGDGVRGRIESQDPARRPSRAMVTGGHQSRLRDLLTGERLGLSLR